MAQARISSEQLYNAVRGGCSPNFVNRMPKADATNIKEIGEMLTSANYTAEYNEWLDNLVNRIGLTLYRESNAHNKLSWCYMDSMEYGAFIQEIGVRLIQAEDYPEQDGTTLDPFVKRNPDVESLMYQFNSKRMYPVTVYREQVRRAFIDVNGVDSLISMIVATLTKSSEVDRFISIKQVLHQSIESAYGEATNLGIKMKEQQLLTAEYDGSPTLNASLNSFMDFNYPMDTTVDGLTNWITNVAIIVSDMAYPRDNYNEAGITHMCEPSDLVLFIRQDLLNLIDKKVLAYAFNRENLTLGGLGVRIEPLDNFGIKEQTKKDGTPTVPTYSETDGSVTGFNPADVPQLEKEFDVKVGAILMDKRRLMVVNNLLRMESIWNPRGLYTNYFLHDWNMFAQSGMLNCVVIEAPTVVKE